MGIKGLLPFLQSIQEPFHVSDLSGSVVGVDGYCWLHRGVFGCALELAQNKSTTFYVSYFMKRLQILLDHNVIPIVVFDGGLYPAKANKENERRQRREENSKRGHELYASGDVNSAIKYYQKSVDVSPNMAECKKVGVSCVVAPYEADAQLAFLCAKGVISACISEDSDLLAFGCRRLDNTGSGFMVNSERINSIAAIRAATARGASFLELCVLAGCDYLDSIKGIGIATACKLVKENTIKSLRVQKGVSLVKLTYEKDFETALLYFKHHCVIDHLSGRITTLSGQSPKIVYKFDSSFNIINDSLGFQIALGNIDPITLKPLSNNHFSDFKLLLYEKSDVSVLQSIFDSFLQENKESLPDKTPTPISEKIISIPRPLLSSSLPNINYHKSPYFSNTPETNDDESVLSPTIGAKRNFSALNDDEDIENFTKKLVSKQRAPLSQPSYFHTNQSLNSLTESNKNRPFKIGLQRKNFSKKLSTPILKNGQKKMEDFLSRPS